LDIPRQEVELVFNGAGDVVDVRSPDQDVAHAVIEEFMLAANQEVARLMLRRGVPTIYRHHPAPADMETAWDTFHLLRLGSRGRARPNRTDLVRTIAKGADAGYGPAVAAALLRSMPRACYVTDDSSHFSLGFEAYCHFTSPIRRYADLVVHRNVRRILHDVRKPLKLHPEDKLPAPSTDLDLASLAEHVNARSLAADRAESRIRRRRVLEFLLRQGGIPTEGQVTMVVERGLIVDLPEYGTSGFLSADLLPGGPYRLESATLKDARHTYRLGETLDVRIHRIDPAASQLDLALAPRY